MIRYIAIIIGLLILHSYSLTAQVVGLEVGVQAGGSHYFGDLNTDYRLNKPGPSGGLLARYSFNRRIAVKTSINYARVFGDDADSDNEFQIRRNLDFKSNLFNGDLKLEFNFLPFVHGDKDFFFTPYLFGGAAITYYNPKADYQGETYALRELGTEGQVGGNQYNASTLGYTYGAGIKTSLTYRWSINVELAMHELFTDYLDDVSTVYPNQASLSTIAAALSDRSIATPDQPQIGQAGRQRGNSATTDSYAILTVGVTYFLGELKCPDISEPYKPKKKTKRKKDR